MGRRRRRLGTPRLLHHLLQLALRQSEPSGFVRPAGPETSALLPSVIRVATRFPRPHDSWLALATFLNPGVPSRGRLSNYTGSKIPESAGNLQTGFVTRRRTQKMTSGLRLIESKGVIGSLERPVAQPDLPPPSLVKHGRRLDRPCIAGVNRRPTRYAPESGFKRALQPHGSEPARYHLNSLGHNLVGGLRVITKPGCGWGNAKEPLVSE